MLKSSFFIFVVLLAAWSLMGFTPFSNVTNVCPTCPIPDQDLLILGNGSQITAKVIAHNQDYFVLEKYGELRALEKTAVVNIKWSGTEEDPNTMPTGDQILLKNGTLLHGLIVHEEKGRFFIIQVGSAKLVAWISLIERVYKSGKRYI